MKRTVKTYACKGMQELFICELKAPGGSSTRWTLNSYDKDNSFTFTGPRFHSMSLQSFKCPYDRKVFLGFGISNI